MANSRIPYPMVYYVYTYFAWANQRRRPFFIECTVRNIKGQFCMSHRTVLCCMTDCKARPVEKPLFQGLRARGKCQATSSCRQRRGSRQIHPTRSARWLLKCHKRGSASTHLEHSRRLSSRACPVGWILPPPRAGSDVALGLAVSTAPFENWLVEAMLPSKAGRLECTIPRVSELESWKSRLQDRLRRPTRHCGQNAQLSNF